jgi:hypothetical protein
VAINKNKNKNKKKKKPHRNSCNTGQGHLVMWNRKAHP